MDLPEDERKQMMYAVIDEGVKRAEDFLRVSGWFAPFAITLAHNGTIKHVIADGSVDASIEEKYVTLTEGLKEYSSHYRCLAVVSLIREECEGTIVRIHFEAEWNASIIYGIPWNNTGDNSGFGEPLIQNIPAVFYA